MARQVNINKDVPISEIRKVKRDLQKFVDLYEKVTFIEEIYCNDSVKSAMEKEEKLLKLVINGLKIGMKMVLMDYLERKGLEEIQSCLTFNLKF